MSITSLQASIAAHESWARTADRSARTAKARQANLDRWLTIVDPDGLMTPAQREAAASSARSAHYRRMAQKSAKARRRNKQAS